MPFRGEDWVAKNLFRAGEVKLTGDKVMISSPEGFPQLEVAEEPEEVVEEYTGPTADDLRREAELFKEQWEAEKEAMISAAKTEAEQIIKDAERLAFEEVQKKNDEAQEAKDRAEAEAQTIVENAKSEAAQIVSDAQSQAADITKKARDEGYEQGHEDGFQSGRAEVERLIGEFHQVLSRAIARRNQIIEESESQIIQLVLQMAKKVIKVISENQRNVVINNVVQGLRKLQEKSDVIVRVNLKDVKLTTDHAQDILRMAENASNLTVVEDSSVDPGGAIIETDFGEIDARIASQLREIEDRILELTPIHPTGPPSK
jgi:flagellar assembly protein FliH